MEINCRSLIIICGCSLLPYFFSGCKKSDVITTSRSKPEKILSVQYTTPGSQQPTRLKTIRLNKDTVYIITENFTRNAGEQLIVDNGTLIKVVPGVEITIEPGAFISANGSVNQPIIFTSNLPPGTKGRQWSGIRIKGKATSNATGSGDDGDNSGSLQFVRVEFASLILESVGSGSIIDHVQVSYSGVQPSFRFYGGKFNARYLLSYACGGATDFYITNGYQGKMQYILAQRHPFYGGYKGSPLSTVSGLYITNSEFNNISALPKTEPIISNLTIIGPDEQKGAIADYSDTTRGNHVAAMVTAGNAGFHIRNSALMGYPSSGWTVVDSNTAANVNLLRATFSSSVVQAQYTNRVFYIRPAIYRRYNSDDFIDFMLEPRFKNRVYDTVAEIQMKDPFNYDAPDHTLMENSTLLFRADFSGPIYTDMFFMKTEFIGAFGKDNWTSGWTNFIPLKTYYNSPM